MARIQNLTLLKETKMIAGMVILIGFFLAAGFLLRSREKVDAKSVVEIFYSYINLWEYDRAYGFLSTSYKSSFKNVSCFQPKSPWGDDWYNVMVTPSGKMNEVILKDNKKGMHTEVIYTHGKQREQAIADIWLTEEGNRWKIDSLSYRNSEPIVYNKVMLTPEQEHKVNDLLEQGKKLFNSPQIWEAHDCFKQVLDIDKWNSEANAYFGLCYDRLITRSIFDIVKIVKYGSSAGIFYDNALLVDSTNMVAHMGRAQSLLFAPAPYGNVSKAIAELSYVVEHDEHNVLAKYFLGLAYKKIGAKDKAIGVFENLLALEPNNPEFMNELSYLKKWREN